MHWLFPDIDPWMQNDLRMVVPADDEEQMMRDLIMEKFKSYSIEDVKNKIDNEEKKFQFIKFCKKNSIDYKEYINGL